MIILDYLIPQADMFNMNKLHLKIVLDEISNHQFVLQHPLHSDQVTTKFMNSQVLKDNHEDDNSISLRFNKLVNP